MWWMRCGYYLTIVVRHRDVSGIKKTAVKPKASQDWLQPPVVLKWCFGFVARHAVWRGHSVVDVA